MSATSALGQFQNPHRKQPEQGSKPDGCETNANCGDRAINVKQAHTPTVVPASSSGVASIHAR